LNVNEHRAIRESTIKIDRRKEWDGVDKMFLANVSIKSTVKNLIFFHLASNVQMKITENEKCHPS